MEFLLLVAVLAGIVWLGVFTLRGPILWGCALFLFATCVLGHEFFNVNIGTQITIDRAWMLVLCLIAVIQRCLGLHEPKPWGKVEWTLAAFLCLLTLHVAMLEDSFTRGKLSGAAYWHLVIGYLFPVALYFIARQSALTEQRVLALHGFLIAFGLYLGVTGCLEMSKQWWAVWPRYIADEKVGLHFGRARGPMVQSVSYGFYMSVCACAAFLAAYRWPIKGKLLAWPLGILMLGGAGLTLTRSVWMGTAAVVALLTGFCLRDPWRKIVLAGGAAAALLIVATSLESITGFQREGSVEDTRSSAECRAQFAYVSWLMFQDKPLFGFGFGNFPEEKMPYLDLRNVDMNMELIRPLIHHNTYLDLLVELGLIGLALYLAVLLGWAWMGWKLATGARQPTWVKCHGVLFLGALASYMIQMLFHEVTFTSHDNALLFTLAGVASGLYARPPQPELRLDRERTSTNHEWWLAHSGNPAAATLSSAPFSRSIPNS
ncbi:MAG: O-antigen ligase family protein [Pirellulales bacterium]|nr:O-antigen ligase family protein [Pirellulales bacterium]